MVALGLLGILMMGARALVPTRTPSNPDLVRILVGGAENRDLVTRVRASPPGQATSTIHAVRGTPDGVIVDVSAPGPRVLVLVDGRGATSVCHVVGRTAAHLPLPQPDSPPPYTVTVVNARGTGGVLDAQAVTLAALTD